MIRWNQIIEDPNTIHFVCETSSNRRIVEIYLYLHHPKVTLSLTLTPECYTLFQNYFEYHSEFGFSNTNGLFMTDMGNHCTLTFDEVLEKDILDRFLAEVLRFDPSIMEIISGIKKCLKNEVHYGIAEDISQELAHGHFGFILESAKHLYKSGHRDVLLKLAKKCFVANYFNEGLAALEAIDPEHKVINFQAAHLILETKNMPEKILNRHQLAMKYLFKCGDDPIVQKLRDKIFAICRGEPETQDKPSIVGVKLGDPEVILAMSDRIYELNQKKQAALQKFEKLKAQE